MLSSSLPAILHLLARSWRAVVLVLVVSIALLSPTYGVSDAQEGGSQQVHTVQSGENLFRIALRYGLTVDTLAAANGITDPTRIYAGQQLVIPGSAPLEPANEPSEPPSDQQADPAPSSGAAPIYHIVQRGQTLAAIGRQYGVAWGDLASWNSITDPNQIYAGQRLVVNNAAATDSPAVAGPTIEEAPAAPETPSEPAPAAPAAEDEQRTYTVQSGDHLAAIARRYNLKWTTIAQANNIANPNQIYAGQVLVIPATDSDPGTYLEPNGGVPSAPAPTIATGKQIVIDLSSQRIFAYEDNELLRAVTVSTGLPGTPTVTGDYRVYWKLTSQTMSGPGYYLPGVPWVMYFYQGYAIHGTYWHNNFGRPMSHGCVNLPTNEAEWFFRWAEVGTPVRVTY